MTQLTDIERANDGLPPLLGILARRPDVLPSWLGLQVSCGSAPSLPVRLVEIAILRIAQLWTNEPLRYVHERSALSTVMTQEDLEGIRQGEALASWSPADHLVLAVTDEMHGDGHPNPTTWKALQGLLSPAQMLDLCLVIGRYHMAALVSGALVPADDRSGTFPPKLAPSTS